MDFQFPTAWIWPGVYELDGDNLTICIGSHSRPKGSVTQTGEPRMVFVLRRDKQLP
jgi:hypothetical protein